MGTETRIALLHTLSRAVRSLRCAVLFRTAAASLACTCCLLSKRDTHTLTRTHAHTGTRTRSRSGLQFTRCEQANGTFVAFFTLTPQRTKCRKCMPIIIVVFCRLLRTMGVLVVVVVAVASVCDVPVLLSRSLCVLLFIFLFCRWIRLGVLIVPLLLLLLSLMSLLFSLFPFPLLLLLFPLLFTLL